jgi:predicted transcriptional regulator
MQLHPQLEQRIDEIARAIWWTKEQLVEEAVKRYLGLESMPLEDEEVYGKEKQTNEN